MADIEFLIHDVRIDGDTGCVSGIVNKGELFVGGVFTSYRNTFSDVKIVSFNIKKIIAYRRSLDVLPKGMSGELYLQGEELEQLKKHFMLEMDSELPPKNSLP